MKKHNVISFLLLILLGLGSCTYEQATQVSSTHIDLLFMLAYQNVKGEDLLNPLTLGGWNAEEIRIFTLDEYGYRLPLAEEKTNHFVQSTDDWGQKQYYIWFTYTPFANKETKSIVYIALPNGDTDKIEVWATRGSNSLVKEKLFYNDVLVWDRSHPDDWITIVK